MDYDTGMIYLGSESQFVSSANKQHSQHSSFVLILCAVHVEMTFYVNAGSGIMCLFK